MDFGNPDAKGAADETIVQHTFFANATRVVEMQQSQMVLSFKNPFVASASLFDTPYSVYGSYKETENTHIWAWIWRYLKEALWLTHFGER